MFNLPCFDQSHLQLHIAFLGLDHRQCRPHGLFQQISAEIEKKSRLMNPISGGGIENNHIHRCLTTLLARALSSH